MQAMIKNWGSKAIDLLVGMAILLLFQFAGQFITNLFSLTVPGPVIGMLLLFTGLTIVKKSPRALSNTSALLIKHLSLFFLPAATGIFYLGATINRELPAITLVMVVSTVMAMIITALCMQWLIREKPLEQDSNEGCD